MAARCKRCSSPAGNSGNLSGSPQLDNDDMPEKQMVKFIITQKKKKKQRHIKLKICVVFFLQFKAYCKYAFHIINGYSFVEHKKNNSIIKSVIRKALLMTMYHVHFILLNMFYI